MTCVYSLINTLERRYGVHWAMGGTGALIRGMVGPCRAEPGNLRWDVWQDRDDPNRFVLDELYADDAVSIEPDNLPPGALGTAHGLTAIKEKGRQFQATIEAFHGMQVSEPLVAGNWFSLTMLLDVTMKQWGRQTMSEICVYRVRDGKIDREQFFYDAGG